MKQIDLDDLPPRVAKALAGLTAAEELILVQGGVVVARLRVAENGAPAADEAPNEQAEVMEQFSAMIHDEF